MEEVKFIGESLWIHHLGHILIILSFIAAGLAAFSYFKDTIKLRSGETSGSWKTLGRFGFSIHGLSIISVIGLIFYAMGSEMYEYYYVFQHVNSELPSKYIFSAFWEGQEGSFMLWMFWHVVLGLVLMKTAGKWESPVLMVITLTQALINIMLLGIHIEIGDFATKIGNNPIVLLRESIQAPIFSNADYLSLIEGNGLNPLLQNYWNVIHPPVLFLGFASVMVPYAFAVGGLVTGWHKEWLQPSFNWALFSAGIFGIGILMGGAWAYEALSFGGYWAWDPVENSSFVPWLTLVAGIHTHLIAMNTDYSTRSTYFLYLLSFMLVLYSTFLTRSGILGDTSVHAFTELGLETQLLILVLTFTLIGLGLFFYRFKSIPEPEKEESLYSREFWMFIGSLVLLFSAILIIGATSLPVFNEIMKAFDPQYKGAVIQDPVEHYNKYQLWIGVFVGILSGIGIMLKYKGRPFSSEKWKKWGLQIGLYGIISIGLVILTEMWIDLEFWHFYLLAFAGYFTLISNVTYLFQVGWNNARLVGAALSHMGFAFLVIGVLASGLNKGHLTFSMLTQEQLSRNNEMSNLSFLIQDQPLRVGDYEFTYLSDSLVDRSRVFDIEFKKYNKKGQVVDEFVLHPSAMLDKDRRKVASFIPDTRHYVHQDIFSHIEGLPPAKRDVEEARALEDSLTYKKYVVTTGESFQTENYTGTLESITFAPTNKNFNPDNSDFAIGANVAFVDPDIDTIYRVQPVLSLDKALIITITDQVNPLELKVRIDDSYMDTLMRARDELQYESIVMTTGKNIDYAGHKITLVGFNQKPENRMYEKQEGDIAVAARLKIDDDTSIEPIFLIRNNQPMHFNEFIPDKGLHIRFVNIDPKTEQFTFVMAKDDMEITNSIPLQVAEDAGRNDWIFLRARVFPGINFFWLGTILMMLGFLYSLFSRIRSKIA